VSEGAFEVKSTTGGSWLFSQNTKVNFKKYFRYELTVNQVAMGSQDQGSGMSWGVRGDTSLLMFLVYNDGSFAVFNRTNAKTQTAILERQNNAAIKNGVNNLRVEYIASSEMYSFSVNEQVVGTAKYVAPAGTEFGMISDMPATVRFDNFWIVQDEHTRDDYAPASLRVGPCAEGKLRYTNKFSLYSLCIPDGWRVDETADFANIWNIRNHIAGSGIRVSYSTIPPQQEYKTVAAGDFSSIIDSTDGISEVKKSDAQPISNMREGVEAWKFSCTFKYLSDGLTYTVIRYYIFNKSTGQFLLFQLQLPITGQLVWMQYDQVAEAMISSISWPLD
jgi:hypothetical protein